MSTIMAFKYTKTCILQARRSFSLSTSIVEKKAAIDGLNINYVQSGTGPKTILLMPGALGCAFTDFKPQIEKLPKLLPEYTIIAWDPPGYGKSIPPQRNFTLDFFDKDAEHAKHLMTSIGVRSFSILGWSDGGITALILAANYQKSVEKLVIWGANSYVNAEETKIYEGIRDVKNWSPRMREPMEKIYGVEGFPKLWSAWIDAILTIYKEKGGDICKEKLSKIVAPTLVVHGKKDPMIHPEHVPYLLEHIKAAKYFEFSEGKHNIHLRYADEFNKVVAEFINS